MSLSLSICRRKSTGHWFPKSCCIKRWRRFFNVDKNMWVPDDSIKGISLVPLPPTLPEEASPWVFKRQTSAQYIRNSNDMDCNDAPEKNMMLGEPCYPDQSGFCDCGLTWKSATLCFQCWFTVRTCRSSSAKAICCCMFMQTIYSMESCNWIHSCDQPWRRRYGQAPLNII